MVSIRAFRPTHVLSFVTILALAIACADNASDRDQATTTAIAQPTVTQTQTTPAIQAPCFDADLSRAALDALPGLAGAPGRIAFVCEGQVWTVRPDGSDHVQVTQPTAIDYEHVRPNRVPVEQPLTEQEILDLERRMNTSPVWHPDGDIIFASIRDTLALSATSADEEPRVFVGASELYRVEPDGSGLQRLTSYNLTSGTYPSQFEPAECISPTFCFAGLVILTPLAASPDGAVIALGIVELHFSECCSFTNLLDLESGDFERLTVGPGEPEGGSSIGFSWSGDGNQGALYLWRGNVVAGPYFEELVARDLETGGDTMLVRAAEGEQFGSLGYPAWSPVSDLIAFCARSSFEPEAPRTVYISSSAGGQPEQLVTLPPSFEPGKSNLCRPTWSPDGAYITVTNGEDGILIIDATTGDAAVISHGAQPAWGPTG